jgi:hypothetical protein
MLKESEIAFFGSRYLIDNHTSTFQDVELGNIRAVLAAEDAMLSQKWLAQWCAKYPGQSVNAKLYLARWITRFNWCHLFRYDGASDFRQPPSESGYHRQHPQLVDGRLPLK